MVLDCRPPLLPVSIDISGVDSGSGDRCGCVSPRAGDVVRWGGNLLGLVCLELSVASLVDPGTDVEDERPTPVGSLSPVVVGTVPMPAPAGVDMELEHVFLEVGVLPAMVTPIVEPEGESAMTPAGYPVPPIPELSVMVEAASPAGLAVGSPARDESVLAQISPSGSVLQAVSSPKLPVLRPAPDDSQSSGLAPIDQYLPWSALPSVGESRDSPLLPAHQPLHGMPLGVFPDQRGGGGRGPPKNARFVSGGPL